MNLLPCFLSCALLLGFLGLTPAAWAQQGQVTGAVADSTTGDPLPGVNVVVKGTTVGTATDAEGAYSLNAPSLQDTLVFSFVGYRKKQVPLAGRSAVDVSLAPTVLQGKRLVVVGYGEQEKENLTQSVAEIDGQQLAQRPNTNLSQSLQGKLPGLNISSSDGNPTHSPQLNIRGFTSINGGSPLVLIDGVEGDIDNVNPANVASVTVLKDAAASAIYGGRAAFGVVLVTTKDAEAGKLQVQYSGNFSALTPTTNTDFLTDGYQAALLVDEAFRTSTGNSYTGYSEKDYEALKNRSEDPSLPSVVVDNRNGKEQYMYYGNTDWWNTLYRKWRPRQTHNVSISGGSDRLRGYLSGRLYKTGSIVKPHDGGYDSYNARGKLDFEVSSWLTLSESVQFVHSENLFYGGGQNGWRYPFSGNMWNHALPFYVPQNPDGTYTHQTGLNNYTTDGGGVATSLLYGKSSRTATRQELRNTVEATLTPAPSLSLKANYTNRLNFDKITQRNTRVPWSLYPGETQYFGNDRLLEQRGDDTYQALNLYANYDRFLGRHGLKATVGLNREHATYSAISASKLNSISVDLDALDLASSDPEAFGGAREWTLMGYFFRLNYNYSERYLLEASGRYDGTSRFPEDSRWGFFPSVSAGWVVSNEPFFSGLQGAVNLLKLRASYGSLGNQQVATYAYTPTLGKGTSDYLVDGTRLEYVNPPGVSPRDITWEEVNTINLGLDASFFQDQLSANVDLFQRKTLGMLTKGKTLAAVLGTASPEENAADLRTRGFEVQLGYQNTLQLAGQPLNLSLKGALSNQMTTITRFDNPNNFLGDFYEGQTIGEIWGYHVEGLFRSDEEAASHADQRFVNTRITSSPGEFGKPLAGDVKYADLNGDGVVDNGDFTVEHPGDRRIIGDAAPRFPYSFTLGASWNNIDLSTFFQGVARQDWYPGRNSRGFFAMYARAYGSFIRKDMLDEIWSPENPDAYFPRLRSYVANKAGGELSRVNDRYLQNVAYLRLKNFTIGYTLPEQWTRGISVQKVRIYFSGENLLTFSPLTDYIDPEAASNAFSFASPTADYSRGAGRSQAQVYPFSRTYSVGINVNL